MGKDIVRDTFFLANWVITKIWIPNSHHIQWLIFTRNKNLKYKSWNYKIFRKKNGIKSSWSWIWQWFLRRDTRTISKIGEITQLTWTLITFCGLLCVWKGSIKNYKEKPKIWENIRKAYIWKALISQIHRELLQLIKKTNHSTKNWLKHFHKEYIKMGNKHRKRCSTSLVIRETKTSSRCHFRPTSMIIIKMSGKTSIGDVSRKS